MSSLWTLRRSATDAKLAGLCGGVAERWGVDPTLVRVGCAVLALCSGVGVVLYLAGWLLLPVEGKDRAPVEDVFGDQVRKWPKELVLAVVVIASLLMVGVFGSMSPFGFGPLLILALLWYFGYYKNRSPRPVEPPTTSVAPSPQPVAAPFTYPGPPTPFTQAAEAWQLRVLEHEQAAAVDVQAFWTHPDPVGLYTEPEPPAPPSRRTAHSARRLRLAGLAVLGLVLVGIGAADLAGVEVAVTTYLAAALLVVGLTLVAATWWGRARGILPVGLLLALVLGGAAMAGPVGERVAVMEHTYAVATDLPPGGDTLETGRLEVDLTRLPVTRDLSYTAHVDLGSLEVRVPRDVAVRVDYRIGDGGTMLVYDQEVETGSNRSGVVEPAPPGTPVLTLHLSVDRGAIQVSR